MFSNSDQVSLQSIWLIIKDSQISVVDNQLMCGMAADFELSNRVIIPVGNYQGRPVWLVFAQHNDLVVRQFLSLRNFLGQTELFELLSKAVEINHFYQQNKFCNLCGSEISCMPRQFLVVCNHCGQKKYPTLAPSIIVAVRKQRQVLLVNHLRHLDSQMFTLVAGHIEFAETAEQTVSREVREETGITVKNIQYVTSQAWAFPNYLMLGYVAEYASGELVLQADEIHQAGWFGADSDLPKLPPYGTLSRLLIDKIFKPTKPEVG